MGNYKAYFVLMGLCALGLIVIIFNAVVVLDIEFLAFVALVLIPLGFLQLMTGITLLVRLHIYPAWVNRGLSKYWLVSIGYFVVLIAMSYIDAEIVGLLRVIWLFIVPWGIALYQFKLVWRMAALRKRQLEKRELLELS